MKVDKFKLEEQDKFGIVKEIPDEAKKLFASIIPYKGHTMYEINCSTGEIKPAIYEEINVNYSSGGVRKKIIVNENCLYISCLNKKAAVKKYFKWLIAQREKGNIKTVIKK